MSQGDAGGARLDRLSDLLAAARMAGADAADAVLADRRSLSLARRLGRVEKLERAESSDLGLRVFVGHRQAIVSTTDPDPAGFAALAERAVAMARAVPEDPHAGLPVHVPTALPDLDLCDPTEPEAAALAERAAAAEETALAVVGVRNSEGAQAGWSRTGIALVGSNGFAGHYARTAHSVSVSVVAGTGTAMERDYDYASAVHLSDLDDPERLGRAAGLRAVRRLNARRPRTARVPVVYEPRVAASLLGHLAAAVNGAAVARGTSFLRDAMGQAVLAPGLTVRDDPARPRGLRSRPFDGEGMPAAGRAIVADGVLQSWILDWRSARQLGLGSTGHAARGATSPPSPSATNLWLEPGTQTPAALMADIVEGLYVTELIGSGISATTGDYSRGAAGFMIRNGQIAEPVSEITVAGNLRAMFQAMTPASDLRFLRGTDAPTIRVEGLTMAGG